MKNEDKMRLLSQREVLRLIPYSRTTLWRLEKSGDFPSRIRLGQNRVGWLETEIASWITQRVERERGGPDGS